MNDAITKEFQQTVVINTLDGQKNVTFNLLQVEEADEVFHESLVTIMKSFSSLNFDEVKATDILKAVSEIDYKQKQKLGTALLKEVIVNGEPVGSYGKSKYFKDYPEEVYQFIYEAIKINYSGVFFRLKAKIKDSPLMKKVANFQNTMQDQSESK